jgi:hypothetical protein
MYSERVDSSLGQDIDYITQNLLEFSQSVGKR